jgi:hypothetical protein
MSAPQDRPTELEERAAALLTESVTRIDGRVRSRLNQARQAAVAEASRNARRPGFTRSLLFMPTAGAAAAAVLVAMLVWQHRPESSLPTGEGGQVTAAAEDLDLIADGEGLELMESDGSFYEWAAAQADAGNETSS